MAIRYISGCTSGLEVVDFDTLPVIGNNVYYLTFAGDTPPGCYTVSGVTTNVPTDTVVTADSYANSCPDCLAGNPTPTPTPTSTVTPTDRKSVV